VSAAFASRTTPPADGRPLALYDGHCVFCTSQAQALRRRARGAIEVADFQREGVLAAFPGVTHEACMAALHLVDADGSVHTGAGAVVRALRIGRPLLGLLLLPYYVPGLRQLAEAGYRLVARHRYKLFGRKRIVCSEEACEVHFG
jgi:predicted DCC family thiol-disulfide oxidoreductase YuxK